MAAAKKRLAAPAWTDWPWGQSKDEIRLDIYKSLVSINFMIALKEVQQVIYKRKMRQLHFTTKRDRQSEISQARNDGL